MKRGRCSEPDETEIDRACASWSARFLLPAALLAPVAMLAAGEGGSSAAQVTTRFPGAASPSGQWPYPNGDLANTREAPGSAISSANVAQLREAWVFKVAGTAAAGVSYTGSLTAAPIVSHGVVYLQDQYANVYAVALATGRLMWEYQVNLAEASGPGPDGVAVVGGTVYGDTSNSVFALSAATGKTIWVDRHLLRKSRGAFEIQPQMAGGRVYLASAYGSGPGGGVLMALNAANGRLLWEFNTLVGPAKGVQALGLGSGGAWETPLVGSDGSVTFGTGNPYQSIGEALKYPSRQLYTDSAVNLDAATGKLRWYYQAVPDDFMDHDLQASPVSAFIEGGRGDHHRGQDGLRLRAEGAFRGAGVENGRGQAQRPRRRFPAGFVAQAEDQVPLYLRARAAGRRAVEPGGGGRQRVRGHHRPTAHRHQRQLGRRKQVHRRSPHRGGGSAQPRHRQGRMGHQGPHDAVRRGHGL